MPSGRKPPERSFADWATYFELLTKVLRKPKSRTLQESFMRLIRRLDMRDHAKRIKLLLEGDRRAWAETLVEATYGPAGGLFVREVYAASPFRDHLYAIFAFRPEISAKIAVEGWGPQIIEALCASPETVERHAFPPAFHFFAVPRPR